MTGAVLEALRELQGELAGAIRVLEKLSALGLLRDAPPLPSGEATPPPGERRGVAWRGSSAAWRAILVGPPPTAQGARSAGEGSGHPGAPANGSGASCAVPGAKAGASERPPRPYEAEGDCPAAEGEGGAGGGREPSPRGKYSSRSDAGSGRAGLRPSVR
jgi:hypothetical protein